MNKNCEHGLDEIIDDSFNHLDCSNGKHIHSSRMINNLLWAKQSSNNQH